MRTLLLVLLWSGARAEPVTEAAAVDAALARHAARGQAAGDAARAEGARQTRWTNPELAFERTELGSEAEHQLVMTQDFDFSGRRGLVREAARLRGQAAEQAVRFEIQAVRFAVRQRFAEVLHHQARHAALVAWEARLEHAQQVVAKREAAGDVSVLERRRAARELARARSNRVVEEAEREGAWRGLAALTGLTGEGWPRVVEVEGLPVDGARADVEALTHLAQAARIEVQAAERGWIPGLALSGGWQARTTDATTHGYVVGLALTLPLFDHGQADAAAARAVEAEAEQRRALVVAVADAERAGRQARWQALAAEAQRFAAENVKDSEEMARMAEAAYAGGELALLELLDAWRGALDDTLHALELARLAREARIEAEEVGR